MRLRTRKYVRNVVTQYCFADTVFLLVWKRPPSISELYLYVHTQAWGTFTTGCSSDQKMVDRGSDDNSGLEEGSCVCFVSVATDLAIRRLNKDI
jgi:hypothetical protein